MIDEEFNDSNINPEYQRIVGRTKDELQSTDGVSITHPDDLEKDKSTLISLLMAKWTATPTKSATLSQMDPKFGQTCIFQI